MIYDCFLFFNELEVLRLRLEELSPVVDRFVLVEATRTFTGHPKPLFFHENSDIFAKHLHKIRHVVVDDTPEKCDSTWDMEIHQRNAILRGLTDANSDDFVIISDVDEIPRASVLGLFTGSLSALELDEFYYRLNCKELVRKLVAPVLITREHLSTPHEARLLARYFWKNDTPIVRNAGWHFSCMQDATSLKLKLQSFSHQEYNTPEFTNINSIQDRINYGLDLVGRRDHCWCCVPLDSSFPAYLLEHEAEFATLLFDFAEFHHNRQTLIYSLRDELQSAKRTIADLEGKTLQAMQQNRRIQSSRSWRLTRPLRKLGEIARQLKSGNRNAK